jgi:hypothetical protein
LSPKGELGNGIFFDFPVIVAVHVHVHENDTVGVIACS